MGRVRTVLTGPQIVGGGVSDLYFSEGEGAIDVLPSAVATFWTELAPGLHEGNTADVDPSVAILDETTGALIAVETSSTNPPPIAFSDAGDPQGPANQALIQWHTGAVVNGRVVRGRMFVPAVAESASTLGVPTAAAIAFFQDAVDGLLAAVNATLCIWHRPNGANPGSKHEVLSGTIWTQWAVLRSRRD